MISTFSNPLSFSSLNSLPREFFGFLSVTEYALHALRFLKESHGAKFVRRLQQSTLPSSRRVNHEWVIIRATQAC